MLSFAPKITDKFDTNNRIKIVSDMETRSEVLRKQVNAENRPITEYIGEDGYVWQMIIKAMKEYAIQYHEFKSEQERNSNTSDAKLSIKRVRNCTTCKFFKNSMSDEPCFSCYDMGSWEEAK